jgi:hypothetical protein
MKIDGLLENIALWVNAHGQLSIIIFVVLFSSRVCGLIRWMTQGILLASRFSCSTPVRSGIV